MKIIGNILYYEELVNHKKVDYINYFNIKEDNNTIDYSIPTLYVGWNYFKTELIKNNDVNILDKTIVKNSKYWEFSFSENKSQHISGIEMFINDLPHYYFSSQYKYVNIDPVFNNIDNINDLMNLLPLKIEYYYTYKNDMIYILHNRNIIGLDINMYNFFEFNSVDILNSIIERSCAGQQDINGGIFQEYYKTFPNFEKLRRYIVIFTS